MCLKKRDNLKRVGRMVTIMMNNNIQLILKIWGTTVLYKYKSALYYNN